MKQRFTYLDIRTIVNELSALLPNAYIQNIYSSSNRFYAFKLSTKHILLLEVGARFHLTDGYNAEKQTFFCTKLRKLLRHNVFKSIKQIGFDRVVRIETNKFWVYFEFYATGNIIITDFENRIIELFRPVKEMGIEKGTFYVVNPVELMFNIDVFYDVGMKEMIALDKIVYEEIRADFSRELKVIDCDLKHKDGKDFIYANNKELTCEEAKGNDKVISMYDSYFQGLIEAFENSKDFGVLMYTKDKPTNFIPYKPRSLEGHKTFESFNEALRTYFHKEEVKEVKKSNVVQKRQEKRIQDLEDALIDYDKKVELMYINRSQIEKILQGHMNVITYNLDWKEFEYYKNQQKDLVDFIQKSDFSKKVVTVKLIGEEGQLFLVILNFMKSFDTNINLIFEERKKAYEKLGKTKASINMVVKLLEKKESKKKVVAKEKITRKTFWFEKFNYCFTSNKKLILSGKNAQQNDILVKKYLTPNDLYFHADIHGASSVILKNGLKYMDEKCIEETGAVSLCMSNAWKSKVTANVYYVECEQVSKVANPGEYLKTGSFMIRGKKNFVDVFRLEYGICLVFKLEAALEDFERMNLENSSDFNFASAPKEDDKIEFGFVLVAPWSMIKDHKYKEKLLPGNDKKSKLVSTIMKNFHLVLKGVTNPKEINAVKSITVMEYMSVIISNCKIGKQ